MEFVEAQGRHYIVAGDLKVLINYETRPDPEAFGNELASIFKDVLDNEKRVFNLYFTGDSKYLVHSNYEPQGLTVTLSELRRDSKGLTLPAPIPRIKDSHGLPVVMAKSFGEDTGFYFHEFEIPFLHVTELIVSSMKQTVNDDGATEQ